MICDQIINCVRSTQETIHQYTITLLKIKRMFSLWGPFTKTIMKTSEGHPSYNKTSSSLSAYTYSILFEFFVSLYIFFFQLSSRIVEFPNIYNTNYETWEMLIKSIFSKGLASCDLHLTPTQTHLSVFIALLVSL